MVDDEPELVDLAEVVRRTLRSRTADTHLIEDLTQETIVRVAAAQHRLTPNTSRAYAIVTARNGLAQHYRARAMHQRHAHRLVDYRGFDGPEHATLDREETDSLATALSRLPTEDRQLLLDHEEHGIALDELAEQHNTTPRAIGTRLNRVRAAMRVEFVLAFRRVNSLPDRCRTTLLALSAGDRRRQEELHTAEHLLSCETCASLSRPIVQRRRGIAGWLILPAAGLIHKFGQRLRTSRPTQAATAAVMVAAAAVLVIAIGQRPDDAPPDAASSPPPAASPGPAAEPVVNTPAPTTTMTTVSPSTQPAPPPAASPCDQAAQIVAGAEGCPLTISAQVLEVPADEGFWILAPDGSPAWVHLVGESESPFAVEAGQTLQLTGVVRADVAAPQGAPPVTAGDLPVRDAHLEVDYRGLSI